MEKNKMEILSEIKSHIHTSRYLDPEKIELLTTKIDDIENYINMLDDAIAEWEAFTKIPLQGSRRLKIEFMFKEITTPDKFSPGPRDVAPIHFKEDTLQNVLLFEDFVKIIDLIPEAIQKYKFCEFISDNLIIEFPHSIPELTEYGFYKQKIYYSKKWSVDDYEIFIRTQEKLKQEISYNLASPKNIQESESNRQKEISEASVNTKQDGKPFTIMGGKISINEKWGNKKYVAACIYKAVKKIDEFKNDPSTIFQKLLDDGIIELRGKSKRTFLQYSKNENKEISTYKTDDSDLNMMYEFLKAHLNQ